MEASQRPSGGSASRDSGIVVFAGLIFLIAGVFNVIDGIAALTKSNYLVDNALVGNLDTWGWGLLIGGAIAILVSAGILGRKQWGRVAGVFLASLSAVAHIIFIGAFPAWSIIILVIDFVVIYALIVHDEAFD